MKELTPSELQSFIERLANDALKHLEELGYSALYRQRCQGTWRAFLRFVGQKADETQFSEALVSQFLAGYGLASEDLSNNGLTDRQRRLRMAMRILLEFSLHGCFQRHRGYPEPIQPPATFEGVLQDFETFCRTRCRDSVPTLRTRRLDITRFLLFLDARHIQTLDELQPGHLSDFLRSRAHLKPATLSAVASNLRSFLRYSLMAGLLPRDLSAHVPTVRIPTDAHVPTVWRAEEVEALLTAVDRSSPQGRRDYAILLLAARLGLRAGDIRTLRLDDIRWQTARLEITQSKTGTPLSLPLSEEIGQALIDYLRYGRPVSPYREVFLRAMAPPVPFSSANSLYHIITFYRRRAGIKLPAQNRKGLHGLRHTVATRLLEVDTPLEVISDIMGHLSPNSTRRYIKVDIEALRTAALDIEEQNYA